MKTHAGERGEKFSKGSSPIGNTSRNSPSNALKISDLPNVEWKPCKHCDNGKTHHIRYPWQEYECFTCKGTGLEPVEVENESVGYFAETKRKMNKLQVGVPFEVDKSLPIVDVLKKDGWDNITLKFLPLYPKVKGDLSVLMVVRV